MARRLAARRGATIAALAILAGALGCDAIRETQRALLFRPPGGPVAEPPELEGLERWWLDVEGGRVEAWYLPPVSVSLGARAPAVIVAHGEAERVDDWADRIAPYREMGFAILLPEYRSYGRSGGVPSEAAIVADAAAFYDRLVDRPEVDDARIAFHGIGLGGGVVAALSERRRTAALVLESTFTNVPDLASRHWAPMGAITDRFDTRDVLVRTSPPTLILHGVDDERVPFAHAVELERVAWDGALVAFHAGHALPRGDAYWRAIREHLARAGLIAEASPGGLTSPRGAPPTP